jgi:hypothetical protein
MVLFSFRFARDHLADFIAEDRAPAGQGPEGGHADFAAVRSTMHVGGMQLERRLHPRQPEMAAYVLGGFWV